MRYSTLALRALTAILVSSMGAGAALATDASLPEDPLHNVKTTTEQIRFDLARSPEQKVAVLLDIAEARLREAEILESFDRHVEASAAVSAYGENVARAAAQLEEIPGGLQPRAADQFRVDVAKQQASLLPISTTATASDPLVFVSQMAVSVARSGNAQPYEIAAAAANAAEQAASRVEQKTAPVVVTQNMSAPATPPAGSSAPESATSIRRESLPTPAIVPDPTAPPSTPAQTSQPVVEPSPQAVATTAAPSAVSGLTVSNSGTTSPGSVAVVTAPSTTATQPSAATSDTSAKATTSASQSESQGQQQGQNQSDKKKNEAVAKAARDSSDRAKQAAERAKQASDNNSQGTQSSSQ
jgi:hypothetical protein